MFYFWQFFFAINLIFSAFWDCLDWDNNFGIYFVKDLYMLHFVFEVVDARIPDSSKNKEIDELIKNKPRILIFTKYDLCDKSKTDAWINHYKELGYKVFALDLLNNPNLNGIYNEVRNIKQDLNQKRLAKGMKERRVRVLILGIPNVGKSTLINRLVGRKATNVGNKPGITKQLEWIRINEELELLDTPGILWPKLDSEKVALNLAATTAIKEEILNEEEVAIYIINTMLRLYPDNIKNRYNLEDTSDIVFVSKASHTKLLIYLDFWSAKPYTLWPYS